VSALRSFLEPGSRKIYAAASCREAFRLLSRDRFSVVICQDVLPDGSWQDLLSVIAPMLDPPSLIVLSNAADEHLWTDALNLGAFEMMVTPLQKSEVLRITGLACRQARSHLRAAPPTVPAPALQRAAGAN
jgi:DNA-binding NtrC family response regulator